MIVEKHLPQQEYAAVNPKKRRSFDEQFDYVLENMPPLVHELIERVPMHVEDYPSEDVMERTGIRYIDGLCGLYTGIPIGEKSVWHSGTMPDVVTIYREGILSASTDSRGRITLERLREQIRITILHELAHHHGLDEDELQKLGYG